MTALTHWKICNQEAQGGDPPDFEDNCWAGLGYPVVHEVRERVEDIILKAHRKDKDFGSMSTVRITKPDNLWLIDGPEGKQNRLT